jgi:hypothetical protein
MKEEVMLYKKLKELSRDVLWLEVDLQVYKKYYNDQREQIEKLEKRIELQQDFINNLMKNCECSMDGDND